MGTCIAQTQTHSCFSHFQGFVGFGSCEDENEVERLFSYFFFVIAISLAFVSFSSSFSFSLPSSNYQETLFFIPPAQFPLNMPQLSFLGHHIFLPHLKQLV